MSSSAVAKAISNRWWIAVVFALLVIVGSLYIYAGPPASDRPAYKATAALRVISFSPAPSDTYGAYQLHVRATSVARTLVDTVTGSAAFAATVAQAYTRDYARLASQYGAGIPHRLTQAQVEGSLDATHVDSILTVTAHWQTPSGAQALALVTTQALAEQVSAITGGDVAGQAVTVVQQVSPGNAITVTRDASVDGAALATLLSRVVIGVLIGIALTAALVVWDVRKNREM